MPFWTQGTLLIWPTALITLYSIHATTSFPCPLRPGCTRGKQEPRTSRLQAREHFEALQSAYKHQKTEAFRASYAARARIEGTHAQAISRCGLRQCRYICLAKTRLQHVLTAVAINLVRVAEWCAGIPVAKTCCSRFAALRSEARLAPEFAVSVSTGITCARPTRSRACPPRSGIATSAPKVRYCRTPPG